MELRTQAGRNLAALKKNSYPGRGIVVGMDETGEFLIHIYWIMGRSENSRNRIFVNEGLTLKTLPADPTKVKDPSLTIYTAMDKKCFFGKHNKHTTNIDAVYVVSNGHQTTDAISQDGLEKSIANWQYEPDSPNFTPRITAVSKTFYNSLPETEMSIFKKSLDSDECERSFFYLPIRTGFGHCITTYERDGNPLPSFAEKPYVLPLVGDIGNVANSIWNALNEQNRISLAVRFIHINKRRDFFKIINKFG